MTLVLAALSLLGLGIFGPGIANGLVSGGPQLGAGAAVGTRPARAVASSRPALAGAGMAASGLPRLAAWPPEPRVAVPRSPAVPRQPIAPAVHRASRRPDSPKGPRP